jgi:hypothetical protein
MQDSMAEKSLTADLMSSTGTSLDSKKDIENSGIVTSYESDSEKPETYVLTEEDNKRVLRKLDLLLMPLMSATVLLQFLDKTSLYVDQVNAATPGLR